MKRVLLAMLVCLLSAAGAGAQDSPPATPQQAENSSPELLEANKLSAEVVRLHREGKSEEAIPLAKRALQLREKAVPPGHALIVGSLTNLAELYAARRKYGEARDYYQRVLSIYEQAPPKNPAVVARVHDNLAYFSYMDLDFDKAEKSLQRALALWEQASGAGSVEAATSVFNLAEFYRLRGEYAKSEPLYQKAIEIQGKALGPDDKAVVRALERYSCLYYSTNRMEKLEDIRQQFSFLREKDAAVVDKGEVLNGKAISLPKPKYPQPAGLRGVAGIVVIKVQIDETGKVVSAEDACGAHPLLVASSVQAAREARFTPTLLKGQPVKVSGVITYRFVAR